jgi:hypothetical protein
MGKDQGGSRRNPIASDLAEEGQRPPVVGMREQLARMVTHRPGGKTLDQAF